MAIITIPKQLGSLIDEIARTVAIKLNYGWGVYVLFDDFPGVLRFRITAPFEVRIRRLVVKNGYDERDAEKTIRKSDRSQSLNVSF